MSGIEWSGWTWSPDPGKGRWRTPDQFRSDIDRCATDPVTDSRSELMRIAAEAYDVIPEYRDAFDLTPTQWPAPATTPARPQ